MIDVWFLFNLLKPFVDIIAQTFIETLREHPDEKNVKEENFAWLECINSKKVSMYALKYIFSIISGSLTLKKILIGQLMRGNSKKPWLHSFLKLRNKNEIKEKLHFVKNFSE